MLNPTAASDAGSGITVALTTKLSNVSLENPSATARVVNRPNPVRLPAGRADEGPEMVSVPKSSDFQSDPSARAVALRKPRKTVSLTYQFAPIWTAAA